MNREPQDVPQEPAAEAGMQGYKECAQCKESKPLAEFLRRTGRRSGRGSRRGACRSCRKKRQSEPSETGAAVPSPELRPAEASAAVPFKKRRRKRRKSAGSKAPGKPEPARKPAPVRQRPLLHARLLQLPAANGPDASVLKPTGRGIIRMRGKTDKGRRWQQETDLETAVTLVKEHAAVVINRHTIRRLFTNRTFRQYILTRDQYTCYFCGEYGDTIDHLLPRAKGGHTTPVNCVCACNLCNQSKADRDLDEFMEEKRPTQPGPSGPS